VVKRISARRAIVLTGTPLRNRLDDLYSLTQVIDPHLLGPLWRFDRRVRLPDRLPVAGDARRSWRRRIAEHVGGADADEGDGARRERRSPGHGATGTSVRSDRHDAAGAPLWTRTLGVPGANRTTAEALVVTPRTERSWRRGLPDQREPIAGHHVLVARAGAR
jgi:hypothetical protein